MQARKAGPRALRHPLDAQPVERGPGNGKAERKAFTTSHVASTLTSAVKSA
jgi:hypothetical protein